MPRTIDNVVNTKAGALLNVPLKDQSLTNNDVYQYNATTGEWTPVTFVSGTSSVEGPTSATDNAIVRFNGTTGKIIQNSVPQIDDSGFLLADNIKSLNPASLNLYAETGFYILSNNTFYSGNTTYSFRGDGPVSVDKVIPRNVNADLTLQGDGTGSVFINDNFKWLKTWDCEVKIGSALTITNATDTLITFDTVINDLSSQNSSGVITLAKGGKYAISVSGYWSAAGSNTYYMDIRRNGTSGGNGIALMNGTLAVTTAAPRFNLSCTAILDAGDVLRVYTRHDNGTDLSLSKCEFRMIRICDV